MSAPPRHMGRLAELRATRGEIARVSVIVQVNTVPASVKKKKKKKERKKERKKMKKELVCWLVA